VQGEAIRLPLFIIISQGTAIKERKKNYLPNTKDSLLTQALCDALVIKKEVSAERFAQAGETEVSCPRDCHACCAVDVVLDLTAVESLMIYLLNLEVVNYIDRYIELHEPTGYCPFFIMDKCIIHTYKPSACQMYMPFDYQGQAVCYYLNNSPSSDNYSGSTMGSLHSNAYAIHGFMLLIQRRLEQSIPRQYFSNIYAGTSWWKTHYSQLSPETRTSLESILHEDEEGVLRTESFEFEAFLSQGLSTYNQSINEYEQQDKNRFVK